MKATKIILQILLWSTTCFSLNAQERMDIPVLIDNKELVMPWNGGFNAPQFANIDLNHDGVTDMISFDRQGDMLRTYIHLPASGRWILDWSYANSIPKELVDWVQIADFDQDGIEDLFTSSSATGVAGMTVYKGSYANDQWTFTEKLDRGKSYLQVTAGGGLTNLYVNWDDIPAISDIDGDGDLDILVFEPGGSLISYYANQSVENGWGLDSLRFQIKDICWGKVLENELSETVYLSDTPDMCSDGNFTGEDPVVPRHVGSTILALDVDADGDKDAFVGDISSRRIIFLHNGLTKEQAWITELDNHYPSLDTSINLPYFVGSYSVQLDDDPEPEFLAAINSRSLTEDDECVWRYDDDIAGGPLNYTLTEKGFLQNEMIDLGSHSRPAVADINGDGLLDLLVGGYTFTEGGTTRIPSLWYFENQGTLTQPYFVRVSDDYLQMSQFASIPTFDYAPAFGDIDNNGTVDLVVGEQNGKLFFHKNIAAAGEAMSFEPVVYSYMNIAVGVSATPQIVDINGDGLGDLVIGERTGNADNTGRCSNLNYFENVGTPGNAVFNADATVAPNTQCFGRLLFDIQPGLPQYSTPAIVRTQQGLVLMTGSDPGQVLLYDNVENGKTGAVTLMDDHYGAIDVGNRSAPALADFNQDGVYELIVGNQRGGLELFSTDLLVGYTSVADPSAPAEKPYHIDGTIGSGVVDITWKNGMTGTVRMFDLLGRPLQVDKFNNDSFTRFDLGNKAPGVYFFHISIGRSGWVEKVVKE